MRRPVRLGRLHYLDRLDDFAPRRRQQTTQYRAAPRHHAAALVCANPSGTPMTPPVGRGDASCGKGDAIRIMFAGPIAAPRDRHLDASGCPPGDRLNTEARARSFQKYFSEFSTNEPSDISRGAEARSKTPRGALA